jgi:hypothetical protein
MNTANKRASAIGIGLALRLVLPIPDATIDAADRQQVAYSYAGIQAANPIPIPEMTRARGVTVSAASEAQMVQVSAASNAMQVKVTVPGVGTTPKVS